MKSYQITVFLMSLILVSACASTKPYNHVRESGFLGVDAALLKKGGKGEPALVYRKPGVDWAHYDKMQLDPVTFWRAPESTHRGVSNHDIQQLSDYFYQLIYRKFSGQMKMVTTPQPNTLRAKVAITKAEKSDVVLDVVSTVVPQMRAASALKDLVTGKPAFVGEAQIEFKITDAVTGELLAEGVDARVGGKTLNADHFRSWGEVDEALQFWTDHAAYRLCELQNKRDCVEPKS
jgi:hypothetical protein